MEEDKRLKLPPNWEAKKARLEWELKVEEKKKVRRACCGFLEPRSDAPLSVTESGELLLESPCAAFPHSPFPQRKPN